MFNLFVVAATASGMGQLGTSCAGGLTSSLVSRRSSSCSRPLERAPALVGMSTPCSLSWLSWAIFAMRTSPTGKLSQVMFAWEASSGRRGLRLLSALLPAPFLCARPVASTPLGGRPSTTSGGPGTQADCLYRPGFARGLGVHSYLVTAPTTLPIPTFKEPSMVKKISSVFLPSCFCAFHWKHLSVISSCCLDKDFLPRKPLPPKKPPKLSPETCKRQIHGRGGGDYCLRTTSWADSGWRPRPGRTACFGKKGRTMGSTSPPRTPAFNRVDRPDPAKLDKDHGLCDAWWPTCPSPV